MMDIVSILLLIIIIQFVFNIILTIIYMKNKKESQTTRIEEDLDFKLKNIRSRMKKVKKETPSYIKLDLED
ncbi:MAG: hypothetical protein ACOCSL_05395 [Thermoplasmatota archaeon]